LIEQADTAHVIAMPEGQTARLRIAAICGKTIFVSLLLLIFLTAIPYGTSEPWWKAAFVCFIFALCAVALTDSFLRGPRRVSGWSLLLPMFTLAAFSFLQILPLSAKSPPSINFAAWTAISADPNETRFVALQLLALTLCAALLFRYASGERRLSVLINVIIAVVVVSAIFGLLRQTMQHTEGFILPLKPDQGYGQFINKNHFAFLMEMGFGLALGMIVGGGVKRERALIYVASLLPIWTALVLSNSRGGLLAMLAQLVAGALLFTFAVPAATASAPSFKVLRIVRMLPVRILLLLILLTGVIVGTVWMGGDRLISRLDETREGRDPSAVSRNEIWRATWNLYRDHPIAGVGMGGYWIAIPAHHNASGTMVPQEAHNDYLELLASGGIIGATIGAWFCLALLRRARANLQSSNRFRRIACFGASLGIAGVAVHSLFDFGLHKIVNALIFMALVVIATNSGNAENTLEGSDG
jgi:O-antigen ligase